MSPKPKPTWHDISFLPLIGSTIDDMLEENNIQYQNFLAARDKPHVFNDEIIERSLKLYTDQLEDHWVFEEQLKRWQKEKITTEQSKEIKKLLKQSDKLKKVTKELLDMAHEFEPNTIDKILAKDDMELALEVLSGKLKFPR